MDAELFTVNGGEALHLTNIGPGHERAARAGEDHDINLIIRGHLINYRVQIAEHLAVQRVQRLLPVNGHNAHMALLFQLYESHLLCLLNDFYPEKLESLFFNMNLLNKYTAF